MSTFFPSKGWLMVSKAGTVTYDATCDVTATTGPEWADWFGDTADIGLFRYNFNRSSSADTGTWSGSIQFRPLGYRFKLGAYNNCWVNDLCDMDLEFLDAAGNVVAAIRTRTDGNYRSGLWYGKTLASLTKAPQRGPYPATYGELTFTDTSLIYTDDGLDNRNASFTLVCAMASVTTLRFTNMRAFETYTGGSGCSAGSYLRIASAPSGFNGDFAALTAEQYAILQPDLVLPTGAAIAHQPGVGLVASGIAPSYTLARGILPDQTGVLFDATGAVVATLAYLNGKATLTVGGVTTEGPADAPYLGLTTINGQVFGYYQTKIFVRSIKMIAPPKAKIWIVLKPGQTLQKIGLESVPLQVEFTYVLLTTPMTVTVANQEARAQFLPQDVAWKGTPPFVAGPLINQPMNQQLLCKGRDYFWIRDGVRNVEQGFIESTVTISGIGVRRRVLCFTQDGELVGETYSRALDGVYRFDLLWLNRRYMVVAQDDPAYGPADYNAVAADYQAPKPYPPGGGVAPASFPQLAPIKRK
ncbi:hypothetical protein [Aeromonas hydrophila]|uniref:hypothetical protein n=2 Tax=Aeromonas hydrophila TaxID=644 RepID=UPI0017859163|nr:hypothetical protein [Aeromonas hydrophila]MBD5791203.1 hypothetical protein [Aeromonas hydrophila]